MPRRLDDDSDLPKCNVVKRDDDQSMAGAVVSQMKTHLKSK